MNDDTRAVDDRLKPAAAAVLERRPDKIDNGFGAGHLAGGANLGKFAPDKIDNQRARQIGPSRTGLFA